MGSNAEIKIPQKHYTDNQLKDVDSKNRNRIATSLTTLNGLCSTYQHLRYF